MGTYKPAFFWSTSAAFVLLGTLQVNPKGPYVNEGILAYGVAVPALQGNNGVDPTQAITLEAVGLGARLAKVELTDDKGNVLFKAKDKNTLNLPVPLAYGTRHKIKVTTERAWTEESETREIAFTTVAVPKLLGPALTRVGPDASVTLHFDRPVGEVKATGDLTLKAEHDATRQNIRLLASAYQQDHKYPVRIDIKSVSGIPLPTLNLELTTPPPLAAETNVRGLTNLGLMLPLKVSFSEPLADRIKALDQLEVTTAEGQAIAGKWRWIGPKQLRFTPKPAWPATSTIKVNDRGQHLRSERGGMLNNAQIEQFSTGTDRKLFVYLDSQRVDAVENGKVVRSFKVSTGKSKTPTVTGLYYIYDRYRHKRMRSDVGRGQPGFYEVEDVPYTQFFHKDFAFHGAYWHNSFGRPMSHGCINMATKDQNKRWPQAAEDAGWLYDWGALGLPVTVVKTAAELNPTGLATHDQGKVFKAETHAKMAVRQEEGKSVVVR